MILRILVTSIFLLLSGCSSYHVRSAPRMTNPGSVLSLLMRPGFSINSKKEMHGYCVKTWQRANEKLKYIRLHQENFNKIVDKK